MSKAKHPEKSTKEQLTAVDNLAHELSNSGIEEYANYLKSPWKIIVNNFLVGTARGFGFIVGMTVVVTLFGLLIRMLGGLPYIGEMFQWIGEQLSQHTVYSP